MPRITIDDKRVHSPNGSIMQITKWKQKMMEVLCQDDQIAKLLNYDTVDALTQKNLDEDQKYNLVDKRIFGVRYNPNVVQEQGSFITLSISGFVPEESFRQFSQRLVMGYLYFNILVDHSLMQVDEGYRQDLLLQRVYDLFQDSNFFGIGKLQEGNLTELWEQDNKYGGYVLMFQVVDFK